nr:hypothetical protein [Phytohabitans suffuscus]
MSTGRRPVRRRSRAPWSALVTTTARLAGTSSAVSRSHSRSRSSGRHAGPGSQAGAVHQPYSWTVVTSGVPGGSRRGSRPGRALKRYADGANCTCTMSGRSRRTASAAPTVAASQQPGAGGRSGTVSTCTPAPPSAPASRSA